VWTEFLAPEILGAAETIELLQRYSLQPLIAMPPRPFGEEAAMSQALRALQDSGIAIGLWPLLGDSEGYWPGVDNATRFRERVREVLELAEGAGARVTTLAVDLEPSVQRKRELLAAGPWRRLRRLSARYRESRAPEERQAFAAAVEVYGQLAEELRGAGIESLAIAVPPLLVDFAASAQVWQSFFATPVMGPGWDKVSPLFYSSMIRNALPTRSRGLARALFAEACLRSWAELQEPCMSLGVVGPGKLEEEVSYESPEELGWDVGCASAAGIDDLALFSLESVLDRPDPEAWLRAFTETAPSAQPASRGLTRLGIRGLLRGAGKLTRVLS
jgi:hypothetical protein